MKKSCLALLKKPKGRPVKRRRFFGLVTEYATDESGVTAIDMAIISLPFFMMFFAVIEIGAIWFATVTLENGVSDAARKVRTGEFEFAGGGVDQFRSEICDKINVFMSCEGSKLFIDVRTFDQFNNVAFEDHQADGDLADDMTFNPGTAGDIVLVRVFYTWDVLTPLIGQYFSESGETYHLINTNIAFRNEPYIF